MTPDDLLTIAAVAYLGALLGPYSRLAAAAVRIAWLKACLTRADSRLSDLTAELEQTQKLNQQGHQRYLLHLGRTRACPNCTPPIDKHGETPA